MEWELTYGVLNVVEYKLMNNLIIGLYENHARTYTRGCDTT